MNIFFTSDTHFHHANIIKYCARPFRDSVEMNDALVNNWNIVLIKGNHDSLAWKNRRKFYAAHDSYHEIHVNGQDITLCHYKMAIWNRSHRGAWHLYGHSHGGAPNSPHDLSFDVGVDCNGFTPVSFEEVKRRMSLKLYKPIDHHGAARDGSGFALAPDEYAKAERRRAFEQLKKEFENE
jgi:calcineurin-like phosphoesterase family protein